MCGILGYVGTRGAIQVLIEGLRRLEYRGYDSAGVAVITDDGFDVTRCKGRIRDLEERLSRPYPWANIGIGHTRWATHGRPSDVNAHPHRSGEVVVVHNGIIENHQALRATLQAQGRTFRSQTDSEILAHLIESALQTQADVDLSQAVRQALSQVRGSYALAVMWERHPRQIVVARRGSPLILGLGERESFIASDIPAILPYTRDVIVLEDGDVAIVEAQSRTIFDQHGQPVERRPRRVQWDPLTAEKGGYPHFMLKEIHEQPHAVADTLAGRLDVETPEVLLPELDVLADRLDTLGRVVLVGCGTSYHAGLTAVYGYEGALRIPAVAEMASEFRYRAPVLDATSLVVAISQSGETADTLAAVELARARGAPVLAVCNVLDSSLARAADAVIYTHAGPEISVASTKAFTTQVVALQLIGLWLSRHRNTASEATYRTWIEQLARLPEAMVQALKVEDHIAKMAIQYRHAQDMLYLGRGLHYPLALEGALKLKEISYIHAEAYPAGEMKHGPIALIDEEMPVLVIVHAGGLREKVLANIEEVKAREGRVIALIEPADTEAGANADDVLSAPEVGAAADPVLLAVPLQLFAYHVAVQRGTDVDQPRNLAKSVTVE